MNELKTLVQSSLGQLEEVLDCLQKVKDDAFVPEESKSLATLVRKDCHPIVRSLKQAVEMIEGKNT